MLFAVAAKPTHFQEPRGQQHADSVPKTRIRQWAIRTAREMLGSGGSLHYRTCTPRTCKRARRVSQASTVYERCYSKIKLYNLSSRFNVTRGKCLTVLRANTRRLLLKSLRPHVSSALRANIHALMEQRLRMLAFSVLMANYQKWEVIP
jgi:hypothetical protein